MRKTLLLRMVCVLLCVVMISTGIGPQWVSVTHANEGDGNLLSANPVITTPSGGEEDWSVDGYTISRAITGDENFALLDVPNLPDSYAFTGKMKVDQYGEQGWHGARVMFRYNDSGHNLTLVLTKFGVGYVLANGESNQEVAQFPYSVTEGQNYTFEIVSEPGKARIKLNNQTVFSGSVPEMNKGVGLVSSGSAVTFSELVVSLPTPSGGGENGGGENGNMIPENPVISATGGDWSVDGYSVYRAYSGDENYAMLDVPNLSDSYILKGKLKVDQYGDQAWHGARIIFSYTDAGHYLMMMLSKSGVGYILAPGETNSEVATFSFEAQEGAEYPFEIASEAGKAVIKLGNQTVFEGAVPERSKGIGFYSSGSAVTFSELSAIPLASGNLFPKDAVITTPIGGQSDWNVNGYSVSRKPSPAENFAVVEVPGMPDSYTFRGTVRVDTLGSLGYEGPRILFRYEDSEHYLIIMLSRSGNGYVLSKDGAILNELGQFGYGIEEGVTYPFEILSKPGEVSVKISGQTVFNGPVPEMGQGIGLYSAGSGVTFSDLRVYPVIPQKPRDEGLYHDQAAPYLSDIEPKSNEEVVIKLRSYADDLTEASIKYYDFGDNAYHTVPMLKLPGQDATGKFEFWQGILPASPSRKKYRFEVVKSSGQHLWYTQYGDSETEPDTHIGDYAIAPDFTTPDWTKNAIYYSAMPDSFYNGDLHNDVKAGYDEAVAPIGWGNDHLGGSDWFGGDLKGIQRKLSYIQDTVGANTLYINPIFTAVHNAGYGQFDYKTVNPFLGTNKELQTLVESVHDRNMKFITDGVYLYSLKESKWVNAKSRFPEAGALQSLDSAYRDRFYWSDGLNFDPSKMPFSQPKLNYNSQTLRDEIYRNPDSAMQHFLREPYRIDGWRLDVPAYNDSTTDGLEVEREMRTALKAVNPESVLMGELNYSYDEYNGDTLDSVWNYARFTDPLVNYLKGDTSTTKWAERMDQAIADIPRAFAMSQYNLLDSHDTKRILREVDENENLGKLAVVYQMTFVGAPVVYYGDEIGYSSNGPYDSMQSFDWSEERWNHDLLNVYRSLIELRKTYPVLVNGAYKNLVADDQDQVLAYGRWNEEQQIIVITNKDGAAHDVTVSAEQLSVTDGTVMSDWLTGQSFIVADGNVTVQVPAESAVILIAGDGADQLGKFRQHWMTADIGEAASGKAVLKADGGTELSGQGVIGGTMDAFRYLYKRGFGDFEIQAKVVSQNVLSGEAGVMIRQDESADSPFYSVSLTEARAAKALHRAVKGAEASSSNGMPLSGDIWLKAVREGNEFRAYYAVDTNNSPGEWTLIPGSTQYIAMDKGVLFGLTANAADNAEVNTAAFRSFSFTAGAAVYADDFSGAVQHSMWSRMTPAAGAAVLSGGKLSLTAAGQLTNMITAETPPSDWSAKVKLSVSPSGAGQESGLIAYGDEHTSIRITRIKSGGDWKLALTTEVNGVSFITSIVDDPTHGGGIFLQLNRVGAFMNGMYSTDGTYWSLIGEKPVQANMSVSSVGPVVMAGDGSSGATALFDRFAFGDYDRDGTSLLSVPVADAASLYYEESKLLKFAYGAGSWSDIGEGYQQSDASLAEGRLNIAGKTYRDLLADVTMNIKSLQSEGEAGIHVRRDDEAESVQQSGYRIALDSGGGLSVYKAGSVISGADHLPTQADMTQDVRLRIFVEDGRIRVYVGDAMTPLVDLVDSTYENGYVSLYTKHANAVFKNIGVYPLHLDMQPYVGRWAKVQDGFKSKGEAMNAVIGQAYDDVSIQTDIRFDAAAPNDAWGGVLLHADQGKTYNHSGYYVYFKKDGHVGVASKGEVVAEAVSGMDFVNSPVHVRIVVIGNQVQLFLNHADDPIINTEVNGPPSGSISFLASAMGISFTSNEAAGLLNTGGDAALSMIQVDGQNLTGFSPAVESYEVVLPAGTTHVPAVTGSARTDGAVVEVTAAANLTQATVIQVTSKDGKAVKNYMITFTVAPNGGNPTPTPTPAYSSVPAASPDDGVNPVVKKASEGKTIYMFELDKFVAALQETEGDSYTQTIDTELSEKPVEVTLSPEAVKAAASSGKLLHLQFEGAAITLPGSLLSGIADGKDIVLNIKKVLPASGQNGFLSPLYAVELLSGGQRLTSTTEPIAMQVELTQTAPSGPKAELVGLYLLNEESGGWNYVGGRLNGQVVTTGLHHFSTYAVMAPEITYPDVNERHWVNRAVTVLSAKQVVNGREDGLFAPDASVTRGQFAAMMARVMLLDTTTNKTAFKDVPANRYYAGPIQALSRLGIVQGTSADRFEPDQEMTREQMMVILSAVIKQQKLGLADQRVEQTTFKDHDVFSPWARQAAEDATAYGIVKGFPDGTIRPHAVVTRAEAAEMLYRFLKLPN